MDSLMKRILALATFILVLAACTPAPTLPPTIPPTIPPTLVPTVVPPGPCDLSVSNAVNIYNRPSAASSVFGTFGPSDTAHPTARTADGFYGFDPGTAQAGNVGLFRLRWVLKTVDVTLSSGCASLPVVVAPIAGICYAMMMGYTPIYSSPDAASGLVTTMHMNDYAMITAHNPGWFTLDLNVGSPSTDSLGYLQEDQLGGLNGDCTGL
jgi:hypothetical protein